MSVRNAIGLVVEASPNGHVLVVGQLGRPRATFIEELVAKLPSERDALTGTGPCDFFDPSGELDEEHIANLTAIIDAFEAEGSESMRAVHQWGDRRRRARRGRRQAGRTSSKRLEPLERPRSGSRGRSRSGRWCRSSLGTDLVVKPPTEQPSRCRTGRRVTSLFSEYPRADVVGLPRPGHRCSRQADREKPLRRRQMDRP